MPLPDTAARVTPTIFLRGITVAFGSVVALEKVDLELVPGARHAVVGENGAGKSTLMKVLFGLLRPDTGEIIVDGTFRRFASPKEAISLGIGMVQQHFELIPPFTVAENVILGAETVRGGMVLDRAGAQEAVRRLSEEVGLDIDPDARVEHLSVASQQRVEILKALYRRARVLILDEPTAVLAPSEARDLWEATARLSRAGTTIVFITHKLEEVMAHADTVTVLRRGKRVLSSPIADTTPSALASAMVGDSSPPVVSLTPLPPLSQAKEGGQEGSLASEAARKEQNSPSFACERGGRGVREISQGVLVARSITVQGRRGEMAVSDVSLELNGGEIVGLAGVDGSGQVELIEALFGLRPLTAGSLTLEGTEINRLSIAQRRARGIGYVPEDRHHRALVLSLSCEENVVLGRQTEPAFASRGVLKQNALRAFLRERSEAFDVRGAAPGLPVRSLSGGNQQKLVMARELSRQPRLLLASQPTRGLDFAASAFVHEALRRERDRGVAVLVQSLDLGEILALSDRVAVMLQGRIVAVLPRDEATEARVGALMTGAEK